MQIPFVSLQAQYQTIKADINAAIQRVMERDAFIGGEEVAAFESEFAAYCEANCCSPNETPSAIKLHCVSCGNGTDALYLALRALGIRGGDEVITVAHTFIATAEAISLSGARPVFVDIREDSMLIDPDKIEAAITSRTKAILPVHLYGQPCDMDRIMGIARRYGLRVIEDAAQAHGASWKGRRAGTLSDIACFSFYPSKNLGAYGDAGAVVSRDESLVEQVRMLANYGTLEKYTYPIVGVNSRMDGLQAAILRVKLRHLDRWNEARRKLAAQYLSLLRDSEAVLPSVHPDANPVWHLFVIRLGERDEIQARLKTRGIGAGLHYPVPIHLQPGYAHLNIPKGSLAVSETVSQHVLSMPMYPELTEDMVSTTVAALRA